MLSCQDALVLTDSFGRILHVNTAWVELTGYALGEVEGSTCSRLQGSMTDMNEVYRVANLTKSGQVAQMKVVNYNKDGMMFSNYVTIVPIRGGYRNTGE
jgi:PAS domain S-box-containing protein